MARRAPILRAFESCGWGLACATLERRSAIFSSCHLEIRFPVYHSTTVPAAHDFSTWARSAIRLS